MPLAWASRVHAARYPLPNNICVGTSQWNSTGWEIENFNVSTDSKFWYGTGTLGFASFNIKNTANGYAFDCIQGNSQTVRTPNFVVENGKVWYSCNVLCIGSDGNPPEDNPPLETAFHFDYESKELSVRQNWTCGHTNTTAP